MNWNDQNINNNTTTTEFADKLALFGGILSTIGGGIATLALAIAIDAQKEEEQESVVVENQRDELLIEMRKQILELQTEVKRLKEDGNR